MNRISPLIAIVTIGLASVSTAPRAQAGDVVTYEIFSDSVGGLAGLEYRDTTGKHLIRDVPLPWTLTVPVLDAKSSTADGAELRADWRPNFRTAATVGRVLLGKFVTVRISRGGEILCESILDTGNATCYGSVPHRAENETSPGNLP
ncbi:hypothetical protein [Mycobacterium kyogaense]|uniref:hypothetical protein n=1 Tax=Mycobacterium kyogaense TaxID=2212479 RepID=UPI000DAD92DC|nr:hypothetical protein [Mycobacterium kyogaense]